MSETTFKIHLAGGKLLLLKANDKEDCVAWITCLEKGESSLTLLVFKRQYQPILAHRSKS